MANPRNLTGVEDALLMALEAQGKSEAVQILRCQLIGSSWDVFFSPAGCHIASPPTPSNLTPPRNKGVLIAGHLKGNPYGFL